MSNSPDFEFFCEPVRAETEDDDGTPSNVNGCELKDADAIGVYRRGPEPDDVAWQFDLPIVGDPLYQLTIATGLCHLLNAITPQEALDNPKLDVFFQE